MQDSKQPEEQEHSRKRRKRRNVFGVKMSVQARMALKQMSARNQRQVRQVGKRNDLGKGRMQQRLLSLVFVPF